jgi:hypothetical protein
MVGVKEYSMDLMLVATLALLLVVKLDLILAASWAIVKVEK